jgi:integrase
VNLTEKFVFIRESKKNKSRYVPISDSLVKNFEIYGQLKAEQAISSHDESYFPAPDGYRYSRNAASRQIRIFIAIAGIRKTSNGSFPRIHDLRHTAAVRILENLDEKNLDLRLSLPLLSTFLGHDTFWETEQYLQLPYYSFNRMQGLSDILNIIPEVDESE